MNVFLIEKQRASLHWIVRWGFAWMSASVELWKSENPQCWIYTVGSGQYSGESQAVSLPLIFLLQIRQVLLCKIYIGNGLNLHIVRSYAYIRPVMRAIIIVLPYMAIASYTVGSTIGLVQNERQIFGFASFCPNLSTEPVHDTATRIVKVNSLVQVQSLF